MKIKKEIKEGGKDIKVRHTSKIRRRQMIIKQKSRSIYSQKNENIINSKKCQKKKKKKKKIFVKEITTIII